MVDIPKVGDRLFCVPARTRHREPFWVVVDRVGRKWATFSREGQRYNLGRFDKITLDVDGGGYTTEWCLYRTEEEYQEQVAKNNAWHAIRNLMGRIYSVPRWLSREQLEEIERLLREPAQ